VSPRVVPRTDARSDSYRDHLEKKRFDDATAEAWRKVGLWPQYTNEENEARMEREREKILRFEESEDSYELRARERMSVRERSVYGPGSPHSWFADFIADSLEQQHRNRVAAATSSLGQTPHVLAALPLGVDVEEARKRLASVETRDVTSGDPGALSFLGPGFVGAAFNNAARAEGSLAAALGLQELPQGVRRIDIPRFDTGATAAVQNPENTAVSQTDVDAGSQAGNVATVAGRQTISLQGLEFIDGAADQALARELGLAIATAVDAQLISGSNTSGQTLGLASVTGIKALTWTDASPTSQELVGKTWAAYDQIANGGQGVADPDEYLTVMHPRRLAWLYSNAQNAQSIAPQVPGRIVACAGLRTNLGAGTNEDEVYVVLPDELPVYASPVRLIVDSESVSGGLQVRLVAYRYVGSGFGRAGAAISRISGTGLVAPVL
jgi:HK97 family phage major capsid protein